MQRNRDQMLVRPHEESQQHSEPMIPRGYPGSQERPCSQWTRQAPKLGAGGLGGLSRRDNCMSMGSNFVFLGLGYLTCLNPDNC